MFFLLSVVCLRFLIVSFLLNLFENVCIRIGMHTMELILSHLCVRNRVNLDFMHSLSGMRGAQLLLSSA